MIKVYVRCYAELNNYLPTEQQFCTFEIQIHDCCNIESLIEQVGLPKGEIDLVLINNTPSLFTVVLKDNDRIAIYPVFETFDISSISKIRDKPLRQVKFVVDIHLGKLASHLRLFGFDTLYKNDFKKNELLTISIEQKRILLSKCSTLISNPDITRAYYVKNIDPKLQLSEVLDRFNLYNLASPFSRCIKCNSLLVVIEKEKVFNRIPPLVRDWCNEYLFCSLCDRLYWKGSHYEYMNAFVQDILRYRD